MIQNLIENIASGLGQWAYLLVAVMAMGETAAFVGFIAPGEFTIILAQIAADNDAISSGDRKDFVAFAGLYVLATATLGVVLMKESKRIGRRLFPPRLA